MENERHRHSPLPEDRSTSVLLPPGRGLYGFVVPPGGHLIDLFLPPERERKKPIHPPGEMKDDNLSLPWDPRGWWDRWDVPTNAGGRIPTGCLGDHPLPVETSPPSVGQCLSDRLFQSYIFGILQGWCCRSLPTLC